MIQEINLKIFFLISFVLSMSLLTFNMKNVQAKSTNMIMISSQKMKINKSALNLYCGDKYQLKLKNTKSKIKWSRRNKSIATVNSQGIITAKKAGTATITVKTSLQTKKLKSLFIKK